MSKMALHLLLWLILLPPFAEASSEWEFNNVSRVVAMSDIHGAYDAMVETLQNADILDAAASWVGGDAHLVIVGDVLDRGADSRAAMDLLMRLEGEAAAAGGAVHVLIGNHEAMNLMGDLRYVSKEEYANFSDGETSQEREKWFQKYQAERSPPNGETAWSSFERKYPPGYFAQRRAFAADGEYGKWLLSKPIVVVINGTAFVHGGLSPMIAPLGLKGVNETLHADLVNYVRGYDVLEQAGVLLPTDSERDRETRLAEFKASPETPQDIVATVAEMIRLGNSDLHAPDGPLWYRGNVYCQPLVESDRLQPSLDAIHADRVVIGHTPTSNREVLSRLNGRVLEVDTGMLHKYYGGIGHALVLSGDSVRVISQQSKESLSPEPQPRRVGERPDGMLSATELEALLSSGTLGEPHKDETGREVLSVTDGTHTVQAIFAQREAKGVYPDVAAYRLDRLLQLNMVPVAVIREVDGKSGSLQFLPDKSINEAERSKSGQGGGAYCPLTAQWPALYIFDSLIYNQGRTQQRMLYSPDTWQLLLVGHESAFGNKKGRPRHLANVDLDVNNAWHVALQSLDAATLEAKLGDVLDARRRRALLDRRDALLK
ncbi:MAG TPA: metallophosphoesterase [Woeseiaceae bacterium]|nr:metallophosphoesterase [Woeseiaceae bacterium]